MEDKAADILLVVDIRDSGDALAGFRNQAGWDTADTGFLEEGMKDNQNLVLAVGCKLVVAADSSNSAEGKEPLEHQKDLELRIEADEDYTEVDIDFVQAAADDRTVVRTREVALVADSRQREVPEAAGFGAVPELAR